MQTIDNEKQNFPAHVLKSDLARALNISASSLQNLLNRKYFTDLKQIGYCPNEKLVNRAVLLYLREKLALLPDDFV